MTIVPVWMRLPLVRLLRETSVACSRRHETRRGRHKAGATSAVESLENRTLLSSQGVTIFTHGFNSNADSWVDAMADEVIARVAAETGFSQGDVAKYELTIDAATAGLVQESAGSYLTAASGQTVIRLDWGPVSSDLNLSTATTAERIADFIFTNQSWIAEAPLHLIGHSRGASMVNAIAAEFAERGVFVNHLTFHDAAPVGGDFPMNIPESVLFADGYWRTGGLFTPDGQSVSGAYNIELNQSHFEGGTIGYGGISDVHSDVHLWYHGTVDNVGGFSDGAETVASADASYWFQAAAYDAVDGPTPTGRDDVGYAFSRLVGFPRPTAGVTTDVGGTGTRTAVDWTAANWPNVLELTVDAASLEFEVGEAIPVDYYFQDADSNADLTFFLDVDANPYNGNAVAAGGTFAQAGGASALTFDNENVPTAGLTPGMYYLSARILDAGGRQRWIYAPEMVTLNSPPVTVTGASVNGGSANRSGIGTIALTFSEAVTIASATSFRLFNHTTGTAADLTGALLSGNGSSTVTLALTGLTTPLPDGRYTLELPAGETTPILNSTFAVELWKLSGDLNGDAAVNFDDTAPLSVNFGTTGAAPYSDGDGDGDGDVNFDDTAPLSLNFGASLGALSFDFGDAPEAVTSYPTTLANDGARHVLDGNTLRLGTDRDSEVDGQPSPDASGDGADEDGLTVGPLTRGTNAAINVTSSGAGFLNAWVDFNQDGDWDDPDEQVFADVPIVAGANNLLIAVPAGATLGSTVGRFRLTGTAGYFYYGHAPDGEVEDELLTVIDPAPDVADVARAGVQSLAALADSWASSPWDPWLRSDPISLLRTILKDVTDSRNRSG